MSTDDVLRRHPEILVARIDGVAIGRGRVADRRGGGLRLGRIRLVRPDGLGRRRRGPESTARIAIARSAASCAAAIVDVRDVEILRDGEQLDCMSCIWHEHASRRCSNPPMIRSDSSRARSSSATLFVRASSACACASTRIRVGLRAPRRGSSWPPPSLLRATFCACSSAVRNTFARPRTELRVGVLVGQRLRDRQRRGGRRGRCLGARRTPASAPRGARSRAPRPAWRSAAGSRAPDRGRSPAARSRTRAAADLVGAREQWQVEIGHRESTSAGR